MSRPRPGYDVWARTDAQPRPSLFLADVSRNVALAEAETLAGDPEIRSVWVQTGDRVIYAAGEKEVVVAEQIRDGGGFRG